MTRAVLVRLDPGGRIHSFDAKELGVHVGDLVVVETENGTELGRVVAKPEEVDADNPKGTGLGPVMRKASAEDVARREELKAQEEDALAVAKHWASELRLPMKFVGAHYTLDANRLFVFFSSGEKVDFRQLVRRLSEALRVRVEVRQMRARDEARMAGGLGRCGRPICCANWLTEFSPVTIRMAKEQALPISAEGLAGQCGRLRCCLRYECEQYQAVNKRLPRTNEVVDTPRGEGRVLASHPLKETVTVLFQEGEVEDFPLEEVTWREKPDSNS